MGETPMSALTLLCSGIQLYSAEQRIADCILADVKWAASATSAELARQSQASEATVARLARENGAAILLITSDRHSPLAQQADHVLLASNREQRLVVGDHAPSQLSALLVIEVLYYLMLLGE